MRPDTQIIVSNFMFLFKIIYFIVCYVGLHVKYISIVSIYSIRYTIKRLIEFHFFMSTFINNIINNVVIRI